METIRTQMSYHRLGTAGYISGDYTPHRANLRPR